MDVNGSPSGTNLENFGLWVDLDSSAIGTQQSGHRQYLYGILNDLFIEGESYAAYPSYNKITNKAGNLIGNARGTYNYMLNNGEITNSIGTFNRLQNKTGGHITNAYGTYSWVNQQDDNASLSKSYAYYALQDQDAGLSDKAYLYYGKYSGNHNTKWGLYLTGEDINYFSGKIGIGTTYFSSTYNYMLNVAQTSSDDSNSGAIINLDVLTDPTENRENTGLLVDLDSEASGTQTPGNHQELFGVRSYVTSTGETYTSQGIYNYVAHNSPTQTLGHGHASYNSVSNAQGGSIDNAYGTYNLVRNDGTGTIGKAVGVWSSINQSSDTGTTDDSYAFYAQQNHDAGTSNTAHLYYGEFTGNHTNKWGVYLTGEDKSYFSGKVGIGTTAPTEKLEVVGNVSIDGSLSTTGDSSTDGNATITGSADIGSATIGNTLISGNLGIGTESVSTLYDLEVKGKTYLHDQITVKGTVKADYAEIDSFTSTSTSFKDITVNIATINEGATISGDATFDDNVTIQGWTNIGNMVGIGLGSATPSKALDVIGNMSLQGHASFTDGNTTITKAEIGTLDVTGNAFIDGNATINVASINAIDDNVTIRGIATITEVAIEKAAISGTTFSDGNVTISGTANITDATIDRANIKGDASVQGTVRANEVVVQSSVPWADYVFKDDYSLPKLSELESFIQENKHLPGIPSATEIDQNGINMASMVAKQMEKIEELTLYLIEVKQENLKLSERLGRLEQANNIR